MEPWNQLVAKLESQLGKPTVDQWIRPLEVVRFDAANLYLRAQNSFQIDWFEEHIRPYLQGRFVNNNQRPIKIHISLSEESLSTKNRVNKETSSPFFIHPSSIDPEMSLENFICSDLNQVAFQIIQEIDKSPFNPLFLYGPKNSGKTHLLMSAAKILQAKGKKVFFVRAEHFTEHVVQAIRLGFMQEFRDVYRKIDALIIDDIHIFSRKNATQEEFFHTFNTLQTHGLTILLSANKAPSLLQEIEPRLTSRFEWGLTVGLHPIDPKLILAKKGALWKIPLSNDLIDYLSEKFPSDPLIALQALSFRAKGAKIITKEQIEHLLKDLLAKEAQNSWTPDRIIKKTASHYGVRCEDLTGKMQTKEFVQPRQLAMYLCRERLKLSYPKIGEIFDRDHSTVMSSVGLIQKRIQEGELTVAIQEITNTFNQN
jgi:chromosomal replication initiator protein